MIRYIVPSVSSRLKSESRCPFCNRSNGSIHSSIQYRGISDVKIMSVPRRRIKCPWCQTTWTVRGQGVGHGRQRSDRLRAIGVVLYMFGLSYRNVEKFLPLLDCRAS